MEYNTDPTDIEKGDTFDQEFGSDWSGSWQVCGICFERITQPILKGLWYHQDGQQHYDHEPKVATPLQQLFEIFCSDNLYYKKRKCKCYFKWRDTLKLKVTGGFSHTHWICSDGITLCGKIFADMWYFIHNKDAKYELPEKQEYRCEKCIKKLVKLKKLKVIKYEGKSKNQIYNRLEWLS